MSLDFRVYGSQCGSNTGCDPFLKWPGGKRWLAADVVSYFGSSQRHVEPFCGAGACFFATAKHSAVLADTNEDLITTYLVVRDDCETLIKRLRTLTIDSDTFYRVRASNPRSDVGRAVRFIYLNRTAFNGLYRVNRQGHFNVPFGCKPTTRVCDPDSLRLCSNHLADAEITCQTFSTTLSQCLPTDNIYIDPPYTTAHNCNGFRRYNEAIFQWKDQVDLATKATDLAASGYRLIVSNADHQEVNALYRKDLFERRRVFRPTNLAASSAHRGTTTELLFVSRSLLKNKGENKSPASRLQDR